MFLKKLQSLVFLSILCLSSQGFTYEDEGYSDEQTSWTAEEDMGGLGGGGDEHVAEEEPEAPENTVVRGRADVLGHAWRPGQPDRLWTGPRWGQRAVREEALSELQALNQEMKETPLPIEALKTRQQEAIKEAEALQEKLSKESNERIDVLSKEEQEKLEEIKNNPGLDAKEKELAEKLNAETYRRLKNRTRWNSNNPGPDYNAANIKIELYGAAIWRKEQQAAQQPAGKGTYPYPGKGTQ